MRRDEPANMMHLVKPLLLMLTLLVMMFAVELAAADTVRVHDAAGSTGPAVTLEQVAELTGEYAQTLGGVVVGKFADEDELVLELNEVREALIESGAAVGRLNLQGFSRCTVHRVAGAATEPRGEPRAAGESGEIAQAVKNEAPAANPHDQSITVHTPTSVRGLIVEQLGLSLGVDRNDLVIEFQERDEQLLSRSCVAGRYTVEPVAQPRLGQVAFKVREYRGTEQVRQSVVNVSVKQRVLAVVAIDDIGRGDTIHRNMVRVREVMIDSYEQAYLLDPALVIGLAASQTIGAGERVTPGAIERPVAVHRREQVEVTLNQGGLKITFTGEAQAQGSVGQSIEVKNPRTRQTFTATITGRRQVSVGELPATPEDTNAP